MLTQKQFDLLVFIKQSTDRNHITPSFDEMREALSLKSKSSIHRLINSLEERGYIRKLANKARAIEIIKTPTTQKKQNIKKINKSSEFDFSKDLNSKKIPLLGKIAAGSPIEAIQNKLDNIDIPSSFYGKGEHYALKVEGDSMIDAGINHNDTVLIKKQIIANNGDIVVALIKNEEATLKKLKIENNKILLEPANINYETQIYSENEIQIQGKLVGLFRYYN